MGKTITDTILKELTDANVTLKEAIEAMIEEGVNSKLFNPDGSAIYLKEADLKDRFDNYDTQLRNLWSAIADLAGRIQSLVYVPTSLEEVSNNVISIEGLPYIAMVDVRTTSSIWAGTKAATRPRSKLLSWFRLRLWQSR